MDSISEEEACGDGDECLESLEEQISAFFSGPSEGSDGLSVIDDDDDEEKDGDPTERAAFWEAQEGMIKEILHHSSSSGSKLRRAVNRAMKMERETTLCQCQKPSSTWCGNCLRRMVVDHLHTIGYDAALCMSKWKPTRDIPGGMHEYIDVVIQMKDQKKEVPFVVELEFRAEFEMAKACQDYSKLLNQLPESYVGKFEHLNALVRVICNAGKRAMNEKKIHMGPWRKREFMHMKWSSSHRRWLSDDSPITPVQSSELHWPSFLRRPTFKVAGILAGSLYNTMGILNTIHKLLLVNNFERNWDENFLVQSHHNATWRKEGDGRSSGHIPIGADVASSDWALCEKFEDVYGFWESNHLSAFITPIL